MPPFIFWASLPSSSLNYLQFHLNLPQWGCMS
jgi:hypothetical protein